MNDFELNCSYYIVFKNQECIQSSLPDNVYYHQNHLVFENQKPIEIQVIFLLDDNIDFSITYTFEKRTQVNIIETKVLKNHAFLHKTMNLKEQAIVHIFNENN